MNQLHTYCGFTLTHDCPPIPIRIFDWCATSEDYDALWEGPEDGWRVSGVVLHAETRETLIELIDDYLSDTQSVGTN